MTRSSAYRSSQGTAFLNSIEDTESELFKSMVGLLQQGISEPVFYGDLVYKVKNFVRKPSFPDRFKQISKHYKRVGHCMGIMRQPACLDG